MATKDHNRVAAIRQQLADSISEIARLGAGEHGPDASSRLVDLHARIGMMKMLYGDTITAGISRNRPSAG